MASIITPLAVLLVFLLDFNLIAGEKSKGEKIIIHVPYKIQHHHHTHTNYKIITIPEKKEKKHEKFEKHEEAEEEAVAIEEEPKEEPKMIKGLGAIQETTSLPSKTNYLDVEDLFGDKKLKAPSHIHSEHFAKLPKFKGKFKAEDYLFSDGSSYDLKSPLLQIKHSGNAPPTSYMYSKHSHAAPEVTENVEEEYPKHVHSHRYSKSYYPKPSVLPHFSTIQPKYEGKSFQEKGKDALKSGSTEYEHIGYLVIGEDNNNKFVSVKRKDSKKVGKKAETD